LEINMEVGLVRSVDIDREMQQAYLDYAMSVIVARALPDARDGLKPVHRRILYAMYDMGMRTDASFKKSARIVGEVLGKYHPHGDMAVYDAMARMAQAFSLRYMLIDGQGNFGSVDGDPPAAMRYTEARLAAPAMNMLADIQKNTVDFSENFDGSLMEPVVLPSALPNLLVNGATGIAVGMSTSIPPHNLGEVVDALNHMLDNWDGLDDINVEDLMQFIKGPDFPTGGIIVQTAEEEGMTSAYGSGRGRVTVQARAHIEEMERGRTRIIVTELPYMTNKSSLIERIAELAREERLEGIADLRDESDRQGLRVVIELNKTANPQKVLQELYSKTSMRSTFGIIMLALVDGEPRMLSLKQALRVYLDHRLVVIRRRSQYELEKARARAHILEGLRVALKNLDEVITMIRRAADADIARTRLMKRFRLTEIQAQAILDMALRRLAALERKKIEDEYKEVIALIKEIESLLRSPKKMRQVVSAELINVKEAYADRRRTQIVQLKAGEAGSTAHLMGDITPQKKVWLSVTREGLVSRSLDENQPRSSGRDVPYWLVSAGTRDTLYLVNEQGEATALPVQAVPEGDSASQGVAYHKISVLRESDKLAAVFVLPKREERPEGWFVLTTTQQGMVKKTPVTDVPGPASRVFPLVKVNPDDRLKLVRLTDGKNDILLVTANGMSIRFDEADVRPMGLAAAGVNGIKLQAQDELAGMEIVKPKDEVLLVNSQGKAKRVSAGQFPTQGRYGQGVVAWKQPRNSRLVGVVVGGPASRATVHLEKLAPKAVRFDDAPAQTRTAAGKSLLDLKAGDSIVAVTTAWDLAGFALGKEDTPAAQGLRTRQKAAARTPGRVKVAAPAKKAPTAKAARTTKAQEDGRTTKTRKAAAKPGQLESSSTSTTKTPARKTGTRKTAAKKTLAAPSSTVERKTEAKTAATRRTATRTAPAKQVPEEKPVSKTASTAKPEAVKKPKSVPKAAGTSKSTTQSTPKAKSTPKARLAGKGRAVSSPVSPESDEKPAPTRRRTASTPEENVEGKPVQTSKTTSSKAPGKGAADKQTGLWDRAEDTPTEKSAAKPKSTRRRSTGSSEGK
jgi:DNA gyrase subunit A